MTRRQYYALAALPLLLAGCSHAGEKIAADPPATLQPMPGSSLHRVALTNLAARQLGIRTEPVGGSAANPTVPTTAVVYDPTGVPWTYTIAGPLTYVRSAITVQRIAGGQATLSAGPPPGTPVVTVGVQELLGVEYGVGKE